MGVLRRLAAAVKVFWSASVAFASFGTAAVTLLVVPALDVLFDMGLGASAGSDDLVRCACAASVAAIVSSMAAGVAATVAASSISGALAFQLSQRWPGPLFWIAAGAAPAATALPCAFVTIGGVALFAGDGFLPYAADVLQLAVPALLVGWLLGIFASGLGMVAPDPYLASTLLTTIYPVLAGVVVPASAYPGWLKALSSATPLAQPLAQLGQGISCTDLIAAIFLAAIYAAFGLALLAAAFRRLRRCGGGGLLR